MEFKEIQTLAYSNHKAKWEGVERTFGDECMLIVTEVAEAMEEHRDGAPPDDTYYEHTSVGFKPMGIPSELADVVIRTMNVASKYGIDLEAAIQEKMAYNALRPVQHGGKRL